MNAFNVTAIIVLIAFAGFLAASESALTSISRILIEELESLTDHILFYSYFISRINKEIDTWPFYSSGVLSIYLCYCPDFHCS